MLISTRDFRVLVRGDYGGAYMIEEVWKILRQDHNSQSGERPNKTANKTKEESRDWRRS